VNRPPDAPDLAWRLRDLPQELLLLPEEAHKVARAIYNARLLAKGPHESVVADTLAELRQRRIIGED